MLSNLVESSISNFENEESVEDGATGAGEIDAAVNQKSQIRIERQASISQNHKIYKNLKSRKMLNGYSKGRVMDIIQMI